MGICATKPLDLKKIAHRTCNRRSFTLFSKPYFYSDFFEFLKCNKVSVPCNNFIMTSFITFLIFFPFLRSLQSLSLLFLIQNLGDPPCRTFLTPEYYFKSLKRFLMKWLSFCNLFCSPFFHLSVSDGFHCCD